MPIMDQREELLAILRQVESGDLPPQEAARILDTEREPRRARVGRPRLDLDELREAAEAGVDRGLLERYRRVNGAFDIAEIIDAHEAGVTPELARGYLDLMPGDLELAEMIDAHNAGVTPDILRRYKESGVSWSDLAEVIDAYEAGVTPDRARDPESGDEWE